ncbi:cytochrome P450 [Amylocarpus encephaloides]|uniref:Cytochrome P450 n=1 Tax=Amylocarpus encephaloides TaxID=45428 RepID=A0A9P8C604_9HELO|nr:cytochrome P450 [Amylocarpus encephaloides]
MFLRVYFQILLGLIILSGLIYYFFCLPPKHPKNIPAVPFWVCLIPFLKDVDQRDTYHKYLEKPLIKHGAVKIFFGARWNLLVQRSEYVAEIFKDEEVYQKTGNQKKIPHAVVAEFLGDNIISARSSNWKLYTDIIKPGLQRNFETEPLLSNSSLLCKLLKDSQRSVGKSGIAVQELLQRYTIANVSQGLLQTDFETLSNSEAVLNKLQSAVKRQIFQPIFMNFPFLDHFPIPSRVKARETIKRFSQELDDKLTKAYEGKSPSLSSDKLGSRLLAARDEGLINDKQLHDNLNVTFVAGQENPQLLLISIMYLLAKHPEIQAKVRAETSKVDLDTATLQDLADNPYLTSMIYEALRLFPPISQLINRRTSVPVLLGGTIPIPAGMFVGYNSYSTNRSPTVWGPTSNDFVPERWGATNEEITKRFRKAKSRAEFISFHGGKRACLGEKFAMLEMRVSVCRLVREFAWELDPSWPERMTPAGPLYPRALRLVFHDLVKSEASS